MKNLNIDKSSWEPVKFGDVVFEPKETVNDLAASGLEHVVGLEHIDTESIHLRRSAGIEESTTFTKRFAVGDVLFGRRRAYLKKVAQARFDGICSGDITVFRAKKNLLPELLPFIVNNDNFFDYAIKHSAGGLSPRVKFKDLASYEFLLPPKDQQAELAELFWVMDEVIEKDLTMLEKLDEYKYSIQRHYWDDTTGKYVEIGDIAKVFSGGTPDRKKPEYWGGNIPWIKTAEVNYNTIFETEEFITELGLNKSATKIIKPNSVLVAMYGQGITRGRVALTGIEACCNQACAVIEAKDNYLPEFIYFYLEYKYEELRSLAHGANQQNLNLKMIKSFKIPEIEFTEQKLVRVKLLEISENKELLNSKIFASKALQKSLINEVF